MTTVLTQKEFESWKSIVQRINDPNLTTVHNQIFGSGQKPKGVDTSLTKDPETGEKFISISINHETSEELFKILLDYSDFIGDASRNLPSIGKFLLKLRNFGKELASVFKVK